MIDDLYVDGNSYASGWGRGLERSISKQPGFDSWVDYFADLSNCENVWNHSLVAKPIEMQKYDVVNFCLNRKCVILTARRYTPSNMKYIKNFLSILSQVTISNP